MHDPNISTDPDWIRERDERLEYEIREQERFVDQEIRQREIRESEQHYEATAKRHSRIRAQLSYETPYDPAIEGKCPELTCRLEIVSFSYKRAGAG